MMKSIQHLTRNLTRIVATDSYCSTLSKLQPISTFDFATTQQLISLRAFTFSSSSSPAIPAAWRDPHRCFSASSLQSNNDTPPTSSTLKSSRERDSEWQKQVIYRGRGIQLFRILVRFKIAQLSGVAALAVPMVTFFNGGEVSTTQAVVAGALIIGSGIVSTALWYYSRRYVGELALLTPKKKENTSTAFSTATPATAAITADSVLNNGSSTSATGTPKKVRFSVLDFWGNREDVDIDIDDIVPPLRGLPQPAGHAVAAEPFLPITASGDRQYILSLRYGNVVDKELLKSLLNGSL